MGELALAAGVRFGKYQILGPLGEGGMGAVYVALHTSLKRKVALKVLHPAMAANPECRARFLREGEAAARITHPHVVEVFDVGEEDGVPFLVMELFEGESLSERLLRGPLTTSDAADIMIPVAAAVACAHDAGVVHRDLKPSNIFLARDPLGETVPKVLDFGISKFTSSEGRQDLTGTLSVLGTASYMSPEQAAGASLVGPASDQYALGLVLYETVTGVRVHDGDNPLAIISQIIIGNVKRPSLHLPHIPQALEGVVMRSLEHSPAHRYPTLRDLARALLPFASAAASASWSERLGRRGSEPGPPAAHTEALAPDPATGRSPASSSNLGRTRVLNETPAPSPSPPPAPSPPPTTLRGSAAEIDPSVRAIRQPKRSSRLPIAVGAALVLCVTAVVGATQFTSRSGSGIARVDHTNFTPPIDITARPDAAVLVRAQEIVPTPEPLVPSEETDVAPTPKRTATKPASQRHASPTPKGDSDVKPLQGDESELIEPQGLAKPAPLDRALPKEAPPSNEPKTEDRWKTTKLR